MEQITIYTSFSSDELRYLLNIKNPFESILMILENL